MAKHNRHVRGKTNEVIAPIHGNTVVDAGDLMFRTLSIKPTNNPPDTYVYPFEATTEINGASTASAVFDVLEVGFLGIAMESSPDGVTENISVATSGIFRMPMPGNTGVTIASLVSAVSPASTTLSSSVVAGEASTGYNGSCKLGYVQKSEVSPADYVEFVIRTKHNGGVAT